MHACVTVDAGPQFVGQAVQMGEKTVCAMTPRVAVDAQVRRQVRELMQRHGVDCRQCQGCPVGAAE